MALDRQAELDGGNVAVTSSHGVVSLIGTVRSWAERDAALSAAWATPGVVKVEDRLSVIS